MSNPEEVSLIDKAGRDEKGLLYDHFIRVTFVETNVEGTVSHNFYATFFGKARELFAIDCLPGFVTEIGRLYLLQTAHASYEFKKNFRFGDIVIVRIRVLHVGNSSFDLGAEFINFQTKEICTTGKQVIIYTDLKGSPVKIPDHLRAALVDALSPAQPTL